MSEVTIATPAGPPDDAPQRAPRIRVVVHRLDGGLEEGESDARTITAAGFPVYSSAASDRPRWTPSRDIKYVVFGSVDDPELEPDLGDATVARKAIIRFKDGEWIAAYIDQGEQPDGDGLAIKVRLTEIQRVIPAVAASASVLEMRASFATRAMPKSRIFTAPVNAIIRLLGVMSRWMMLSGFPSGPRNECA